MVKNPEQKHVTRDEQIEYLESQIQAYKARTSLLQQQQISTLDTLDEVLERHRRELDEESTAKRLLEQRLRRHRDILREVEKERDELRDAVLELIDRVEHSHNDFKLWPYSKLQLSSYTNPIAGVEHPQNSSVHPSKVDEMQENLTYADGIIRALKHELHLERQAHAQMRARVHILEAQVASRDAALEAWAQRTGTSTPISVRTQNKNGKGKGLKKGKGLERDLDRAEISSLFIQTVSHNRMLEQEIRHLFNNLEKARSRAEAQSVLQSQPPLSSSPPPILSKQPSGEATTSRLPSPDRGRTRERKSSLHLAKDHSTHTRPSSSPQEPHFTGAAPLSHPPPIAGPSNPPTPPQPSSSRRRPSPSPQPRRATSHSPDQHTRQPQEPRRHRSHSLSRRRLQTPRPPTPGIVSSPNILQRFDNQIHLLSSQIDAFRGEREALLRAINSHLSTRGGAAAAAVVDDTSYEGDDLPDQEGFVERHIAQTPRPSTPTSPPTNVFQRFDDQIHILSVQIDTFRAEREALIRIINSQLYGQGGPGAAVAVGDTSYQGGELFEQGESFTESEIEVGNVSETDYRPPAEHLVPDAVVDEDEGGDGSGGGNGQEDEGTEGGERSMDLATPLFPVLTMLPAVDMDSRSPPAHFPPSPLLPAAPAVSASSPSRNGSRSRSHSRARSADPNDTHGAGLGDMDDDRIRMTRPRMRADAPSPPP